MGYGNSFDVMNMKLKFLNIPNFRPSLFDGAEGPYFCPGEQRHFNVTMLDVLSFNFLYWLIKFANHSVYSSGNSQIT